MMPDFIRQERARCLSAPREDRVSDWSATGALHIFCAGDGQKAHTVNSLYAEDRRRPNIGV